MTGYREYMEEAFDVNAFHYLIKPIDAEKFSEVFSRLYIWNFLEGKYRKRIVLPAWYAAFFLIQIVLFEILEGRFPFSEVMEIIINICVLMSALERSRPKWSSSRHIYKIFMQIGDKSNENFF